MNIDFAFVLPTFQKRSSDIHRREFEWFALLEERHVTLAAIRRNIPGTACANAHDVIDVGSHIGLIERLFEDVVHSTVDEVYCG